jgi:hypothetical protein
MEFRTTIFGAVAAGVLAVLGCPAIAQEAPEAVYQKFHQAARAADASAMSKLSTAQRAQEIADSWWFERKLLAATFPETYQTKAKQISEDGNRMQLRATAMHSIWGGKPAQMYGIVDLVRIKGEWKVDKVGWANDEWPEEKVK